MKTIPAKLAGALLALAFVLGGVLHAEDRDAVTKRVRAELATIIKKEAAKLPTDKPVMEIGADDLDVVEWVMAVEEVYHVPIPDAKIMDAEGKKILKEVTIAYIAKLVTDGLEKAAKK